MSCLIETDGAPAVPARETDRSGSPLAESVHFPRTSTVVGMSMLCWSPATTTAWIVAPGAKSSDETITRLASLLGATEPTTELIPAYDAGTVVSAASALSLDRPRSTYVRMVFRNDFLLSSPFSVKAILHPIESRRRGLSPAQYQCMSCVRGTSGAAIGSRTSGTSGNFGVRIMSGLNGTRLSKRRYSRPEPT